ncbi:MAG: hypothetical protein AAFQ54_13285 [Pseudomonadota bacterium]
MPVAQTDLRCTACGGQCAYSPREGALVCDSCGTAHEIIDDARADPAAETAYRATVPDVPVAERSHAHRCTACGGSVIIEGAALSERCSYCNGPLVRTLEDVGYPAMALIPFQIVEDIAWQNARAWIAKRLAAPAGLAASMEAGRMATLYAPFFTFDSTELVDYWGTYTTKVGKQRVRRRETGVFETRFDDLLVPASPHITPLIRDGVLHDFDPGTLRHYAPAYIAGFPAERHHLNVENGLMAKQRDKDLLIRNQIQRHSRRRLSNIGYNTATSGVRYRRILLPVYILHYEHRAKAYKVVTCGLHGKTFGERPFDHRKLFGYAAAISVAAVFVGLLYGLAGLP